MTTARVIAILFGLLFIAVGVYFLIWPVKGAAVLGITIGHPVGVADIRAVYGGLDLATGFLICIGALYDLRSGLMVQTFAFGGLLLGRLIGQILDQPASDLALILIAIEAAGFGAGLFGLHLLRNRRA